MGSIVSTVLSFLSITLVRVVCSFSRVPDAVSSCFLTLCKCSPNNPNSVFTAPSTFHTSLLRFWIASVLKPICRLLSKCRQGGGPGNCDPVVPLQGFKQTRMPQHFCIEAFHRQEHDPEIGGMGRIKVLFTDLLGKSLHRPDQYFLAVSICSGIPLS